METVLIVIHLVIVIVMAGVILLQRSEGGALGIGGGGGNFMSSRGSGNVLTRVTAVLAGLFFLTSIGLTILGNFNSGSSILDRLPGGRDGGIQPLVPTAPLDNSTAPTPQVPTPDTEGPQVPSAN